MAKLDPNLVKAARENLLRLVKAKAAEKRGEKVAFSPMPADAGMPPPGAGAMPPPAPAGGGAPPPMPMDPMAGGGGPPMDPMAGGMGDPAAGPPIVQVGLPELMQIMQMSQGGVPAEGAPAGAPNEPAKPKGGKNEALEGKLDAVMQKLDMLLGFFAAQMGMSPGELMANGGVPTPMGEGEALPPEAGAAELPQVGGAAPETPPAPEGVLPPLQPQAEAKPKPKEAEAKPESQPQKLHNLVGKLLS